VIVQLEARLERKLVHGGDVGKKCELQRAVVHKEFRGAAKVFARDYDRRFASKFNHFGDGLRVPLLQPLDKRILLRFRRIHCDFVSGERDQ
jgi:hypothetical protein